MVTAVYAMGYVYGASLWLIGWTVCAILYVGGCMLVPSNRRKGCRLAVWIGLLLADVITDIGWMLLYFPDGDYINYGIGAVGGLLLWPLLLLVTGIVVTTRNRICTARSEETK